MFRECRKDTIYTSAIEIDPNTGEHKEYKGIDAFLEAETHIRAHIAQYSFYSEPKRQREQAKIDLVKIYKEKIHDRSEQTISPYFRVTYGIIKRIHKDKILSTDEKLDYIRILRGQIGSSELCLLGFNGLLPSSKDLSLFIEEYRLLKYIPDGAIKKELQKAYSETAFQGRD